jgi:carbamoyl-phosphate synthase large subunit
VKSWRSTAASLRCESSPFLEFGKRTLLWEDTTWELTKDINTYPLYPNDLRLWAVMAALRRGIDPHEIAKKTQFDMWFIRKFMNIVNMERRLLSETLIPDLMWEAKRLGFSDVQIATLADRLPEQVRELRHEWNICPVYKMVDTCAAEFDAETLFL